MYLSIYPAFIDFNRNAVGGNVLPSLLFALGCVTISDSRKGWLDKGNENVLNILLERFFIGG